MKTFAVIFLLCASLCHARETYVYTADTSVLGNVDLSATSGNPLKGLCTSPDWADVSGKGIPTSLEYYYIRFDKIMTGPNTFDWSTLDDQIATAKANLKHVIWRIYIHYPTLELALPDFLRESVTIVGGQPLYDDPELIAAMGTFIDAWAARYDGHKTVGFVQLGLLGKWGEWHTYPETGLLSQSTKDTVAAMFTKAFKTTKLLMRYPMPSTNDGPIGYIDDSFAHSTLDGEADGGETTSWYFWPSMIANGQTEAWRTRPMGGETRPEIQGEVFEPGYAAGTKNKQDFMQCVRTTHASYMLHNDAFSGSGYSGEELTNALRAHVEMGYNFQVTNVGVTADARVDVTVKQVGLAPFYYPLSLELVCDGFTQKVDGVEAIIDMDEEKMFTFTGLPATSTCRGNVEVKLTSAFVEAEKGIKFAQGSGSVSFSIPA